MGRYLLDTNIVAYILGGEEDKIHRDVLAIINDYNNICETRSVSMIELSHLLRRGKISLRKGWRLENILDIITNELNINIAPFGETHMKTMFLLDTEATHNDPDDFAIISHAITDRYTLISSDSKFKHYIPQKLNFVYNKR